MTANTIVTWVAGVILLASSGLAIASQFSSSSDVSQSSVVTNVASR